MSDRIDAVVIGVGGMGGAALFHLASRGLSVLGLEQQGATTPLASSASPSRGFRKAYFSDSRYVTLARSAEALWRALEEEAAVPLLDASGALFIGPREHPGVSGVTTSVRQHGLRHELFDASGLAARFPALRPHPEDVGILETDAGVLDADACNASHRRRAVARGAVFHENERVRSVESRPDELVVTTDVAEYRTAHVVLTTGPWLQGFPASNTGLPAVPVPLRVERQAELWFEAESSGFDCGSLPSFHVATRTAGRTYYGIPELTPGGGVKACRHYGGPTVTAETVDRAVSPTDEADVRSFLSEYLPRANGSLLRAKVCLNTNTPDMHFVLGPHPAEPRVVLAGGFSGHGFKFASVVGEILAELVTTGKRGTRSSCSRRRGS